jgi:hypothetical protein
MNINWFAIYIASSLYTGLCLAFLFIGGTMMGNGNSRLVGWSGALQILLIAFVPVVNSIAAIGAPLWLLIYYRRGFREWWYWVYLVFVACVLWSFSVAANWK